MLNKWGSSCRPQHNLSLSQTSFEEKEKFNNDSTSSKEEEQLADFDEKEDPLREVDRRLTNIVSCHYKKWDRCPFWDVAKAGIVPSQAGAKWSSYTWRASLNLVQSSVPLHNRLFNFLHLVRDYGGRIANPSFVNHSKSRVVWKKFLVCLNNNRKWRGEFASSVFEKTGCLSKLSGLIECGKCVPPPEDFRDQSSRERFIGSDLFLG
nr:hypothetical protein Iba_chr10cCG10020 [Ipomoea batatas]